MCILCDFLTKGRLSINLICIMKLLLLFGLAITFSALGCKSADSKTTKVQSPVTTKSDHVDTYFDVQVPDPYHWLENDTSEATGQWVEAQNKVTFGYLDQISWRANLKKRL